MSKMYVILVIFLLNRIIYAENSSEEKYIDLLPEKEKEEFLEQIARRIFNGVQSKDDRDGVSGEVSETELNEHSEFVKQILKEESNNFRKSSAKDGNDGELSQNKDENDKERLDKKDIDAADDTRVDLTLRDNKRDKRNSFTNTDEESKIVRINVSNLEANEQDQKKTNEDKNEEKEGSDKEDIQIKHFPRSKVKNRNEIEITTESKTTNNFDSGKETNDSKETLTASHGNLDESDKDVKLLETKVDNNADNIEVKIVEYSTQKIVVSQSNLEESLIDVKSKEKSEIKSKNPEIKDFIPKNRKTLDITYNNKSDESSDDNSAVPLASESTTIDEPTSPKEKREIKSDDNIDDVNNKNPDIKDSILRETLDKNKSEESSDGNSAIPLASERTSIHETTPDIKPTIIQTEKLTIGDHITEANENTDSQAHFLKSDTVKTNLKDDEPEYLKNVTVEKSRSDADIDIVSVAMETMSNLNKINITETIKNKSKKEYQLALDINNNTHLENNIPKASLINQADTTELHTTKRTTMKTEVLAKAAMRMGMELPDSVNFKKHAVINDKETTSGILIHDLNKKIIKSKNEGKVEENKEIFRNVIKKEKSDDDTNDKNSFSLVNDIIKVIRAKLKPDRYSYGNKLKTIPLYNDLKQENYKVHEVPTDNKPFIKKHREDINEENPYYAPIYNYSPDNAYYNPYNKLGPNADDNKGDIIDEKYNENDSFNGKDDDKYNSDVSNISLDERDDSLVTEERKQYGVNKKDLDPNLDRLIKGYTKYKNQRKFKFGNKHNQMKKSPYKLKLPVVVQNSKFTDIILNPNDYLDMDYSYDTNQESPNIGRCELPRTKAIPDKEDTNTNNLKSRVREVRQLLYKNKIFGYVPPPDNSDDNEEDKSDESRDILRANNERSTDENKSIAMDYFFGRSQDATDNRFEIVDNNYSNERDIFNHKIKENTDSLEKNEIKPVTPFTINKEEMRSSKRTFKTIREVLSVSDAKDLVTTVDKLMSLNLTTRSNDEIEAYVTVLKDMVGNNAKALKQYDWLGTTVDIQSALLKLMDMADGIQSNIPLSHPDLQLLKYIIYLHKATKKVIREQSRKSKMLPRNRKKIKGFIKESGLLNRHWLFRMMAKKYDTIITNEDFDEFNEFLNELQYYLYDLHTAVQEIANITKYNNQNWFENLKDLYIDTKRKHILEILLHVTTTRLLDLIENGAQNGVEKDFLTFVINNEDDVKKTKVELEFAQKIIVELQNCRVQD